MVFRLFKFKSRKGPEETYFERIVRLKPFIEAESGLIERMAGAFRHLYLGEELPNGVSLIGRGDSHEVFGIGKIKDPERRGKTHLALRAIWDEDRKVLYRTDDLDGIEIFCQSLAYFEDAFVSGEAPYFAGVVSWNDPRASNGSAVLGFLLEDVSDGGKNILSEGVSFGREYCLQHYGSERNRILIDPFVFLTSEWKRGEKYLSDEARIDVS